MANVRGGFIYKWKEIHNEIKVENSLWSHNIFFSDHIDVFSYNFGLRC